MSVRYTTGPGGMVGLCVCACVCVDMAAQASFFAFADVFGTPMFMSCMCCMCLWIVYDGMRSAFEIKSIAGPSPP